MMAKSVKTSDELSERFEAAFNRIHNYLKSAVKQADSDAFIELLHVGARKHASIRKHLDELKQFAKLRNAIVHEKTEADYYIAQPHKEIVERIEQIDTVLSEPAEAQSIASSPVYIVETDTPLLQVLDIIRENGLAEYPVYEQGRCKGLLAGTEILTWMAEHEADGKIDLNGITVKDITTERDEDSIAFVKKEANIFDVEYTFEEYQSNDKKLEAILITPGGKSDELPVGMITSWDLIKNNDIIMDS